MADDLERFIEYLGWVRTLEPAQVARGLEQSLFVSAVDPPGLPTIRDLSSEEIATAWRRLADDMVSGKKPEQLSLYVHVPFCSRRCTYCIFHSKADQTASDEWEYLDKLKREIEPLSEALEGLRFSTCYIGGGTPTCLKADCLAELLDLVARSFLRRRCGQWAFECNPLSASPQKARLFEAHGFNHVNIGVQTLNRQALNMTKRGYQTEEMVAKAVRTMQASRFYVNVDLLHGLPGDDPVSLQASLRTVFDLGPQRVTIYDLSPSTPLDFDPPMDLPKLAERLEGEGRKRGFSMMVDATCLEFTRPDDTSRLSHERSLGSRAEIYDDTTSRPSSLLGVGPRARSYLYGELTYLRSTSGIGAASEQQAPVARGRALSLDEERSRFLVKALAEPTGLAEACYQDRFGESLHDRFGAQLDALETLGLLENDNGIVRLSADDPAKRFAAELVLVDPELARMAMGSQYALPSSAEEAEPRPADDLRILADQLRPHLLELNAKVMPALGLAICSVEADPGRGVTVRISAGGDQADRGETILHVEAMAGAKKYLQAAGCLAISYHQDTPLDTPSKRSAFRQIAACLSRIGPKLR